MWGKKHKPLAVALTCADWRLHQRKVDLNARLAKLLHVEGVDLIALPGPDGLLKPERAAEWKAAVGQIKLLIVAHARAFSSSPPTSAAPAIRCPTANMKPTCWRRPRR